MIFEHLAIFLRKKSPETHLTHRGIYKEEKNFQVKSVIAKVN